MSAPAVDALWIAFWAFGFGCAVVAFTVGCWVGRGVGLIEAGRVHDVEDRPNPTVRRSASAPEAERDHEATQGEQGRTGGAASPATRGQ